jgi:hypothetical protein
VDPTIARSGGVGGDQGETAKGAVLDQRVVARGDRDQVEAKREETMREEVRVREKGRDAP